MKITSMHHNQESFYKSKIGFQGTVNSLYLKSFYPKRQNNLLMSKSSNRASSTKRKTSNNPIKQLSTSNPKNQNKNFLFTKSNSISQRKNTTTKSSLSASRKSNSLNNSYFKPQSVNDSLISRKNLNITSSARKKNQSRAKTPNLTKLNSNKVNVSKLNLSSLSMGASPNLQKINLNSSNNHNDKEASPFKKEMHNINKPKKIIPKHFTGKNIFASKLKMMNVNRKKTPKRIITFEENSKMNKSTFNINMNTTSTNNTTNNINNKSIVNSLPTNNNNLTPILINKKSLINNENTNASGSTTDIGLTTQLNSKISSAKSNSNKDYNNSLIVEKGKDIKIIKTIKCMHDLSKTGMNGGDKKYNQDRCFIYPNFNNSKDNIYMGVW